MKDVAIFGAGGFGREVACLINSINNHIECKEERWNLIGFFDDVKEKGFKTEFGEVLGGMKELNRWMTPIAIAIGIGSPRAVKAISGKITNEYVSFPNLISPDVTFYDKDSVKFGKGNIVCPQCLISCNVRIGNFNIFNNFITVGHDVVIADYNSIMPAARISGNVSLGECNFIGVASIILQTMKVGNNTTVGAGSVIMRKPKDGCTYVGNPAKKVEY